MATALTAAVNETKDPSIITTPGPPSKKQSVYMERTANIQRFGPIDTALSTRYRGITRVGPGILGVPGTSDAAPRNVPAPAYRYIASHGFAFPTHPGRCSLVAASLRGSCRRAAFLARLASPCVGRSSVGLVALRPPPARRPPASSLCLVRLASGGRRCGRALAAAARHARGLRWHLLGRAAPCPRRGRPPPLRARRLRGGGAAAPPPRTPPPRGRAPHRNLSRPGVPASLSLPTVTPGFGIYLVLSVNNRNTII